MDRRSGRSHAIALEQVEGARLPPAIHADGVVRAPLERPACWDEGVLVEVAVVLAGMLDELAGKDIGEAVGPFLELAISSRARGQVDRRRAAADQGRALDVGVDVAGKPTLRRRGDVGVDPGLLRPATR